MELVTFLLLIPAIVWTAVGLRWASLPVLGFIAILVGGVLGPEFYSVRVGPLPVTLDRILWGGFGFLVLVSVLRRTDGPLIRTSPIDLFLLSWLVLVLVSTFSHDWRRDDNLPLGRLIFFQFIPLSYFWLGRHLEIRAEDLRRIAVAGVAFGLYLALTGIAERFEWHALVFPQYIVVNENIEFYGRARGPFINPIGNGIAMSFALGCCCLLWQDSGRPVRLGLVIAILLLTIGIGCTMTRSVWLGWLVSLGLMVWFAFPVAARGLMITSAAVAGIIVLFALAPYLNEFKRDRYVSAEEMSQSVSLRPMMLAVALEMGREKPFFGHGYGQYKKVSEPYHRTDRWGLPLQIARPYLQHNLFLAYLAELGLAGFSLAVAFHALFLFNAWRLLARDDLPSGPRVFGLLVLVFNLNWLLNGMLHDVSLIVVIGSLFFFLNGLAYAMQEQWPTRPPADSDRSRSLEANERREAVRAATSGQ